MKMVFQSLVLTCAMMMVGACGSDDSLPGAGKAEFTFSGEIEKTFTGEAMHLIQQTSVGDIFMLALYSYQSENDFTAISIVNMKGEVNPGTYKLNDDSDYLVGMVQKIGGVMSVIGTDTGELVMIQSGDSGFSGTLKLQNSMPLAIEVTFEAVAGTVNDLPKGLGAAGG